MSYKVDWITKRKKEKNLKQNETARLLKVFSKSKHYNKLSDLTKLYIDCHDLMTRIGEEIAEIADDKS